MHLFVQTAIGAMTIIVTCIVGALAILMLLYWLWPPASRMAHNDVVGPSVGVIGTTYAVIIAFMLSGVWGDFQAAQVNAEQEANCLVNIFRFADRLPKDSGARVQSLAREYANVMLSKEWPYMADETLSEPGHDIMQNLWRTLLGVQNQDQAQQMVLDHTLSELTTLTEHRRIRLLQSRKRLPPILWAVLITGGIVTIGSTCLFGVVNFRLHMVQVFAITFLLSLMLVAIADIDRPFQGDIRVPPDGFRFAVQTFDQWKPAQ
jgi:Protein of unknown function (DUF4239)